ncbi:hypothetical protein [Pseudodesulfovibrio sp.]|uniref:hypothetical protein n=1 Tax=unclassified Pseudodesulfovibrio TaxID=2661612 RepID=UPI003B00C245
MTLIGIDLDNTLVAYGHAFRDLAVERGLADSSIAADKSAVRAEVWAKHDDIAWQHLQAAVYGPEISRGLVMAGAAKFLLACRDRGLELVIVSHKSEFASIDPGGCNLRTSAMGWLELNGFFRPVCAGGFGFSPGEVFFEGKRSAKVERINGLGCDVFIDDLPEVLTHPDLAPSVRRILHQPQPGEAEGCELAGPWPHISRHLLGGD